jgi:hypothetical protein
VCHKDDRIGLSFGIGAGETAVVGMSEMCSFGLASGFTLRQPG